MHHVLTKTQQPCKEDIKEECIPGKSRRQGCKNAKTKERVSSVCFLIFIKWAETWSNTKICEPCNKYAVWLS